VVRTQAVMWPSPVCVYGYDRNYSVSFGVFVDTARHSRRSFAVFNLPSSLPLVTMLTFDERFSGFQTTETPMHTASSAGFTDLLGRTLYALAFLY